MDKTLIIIITFDGQLYIKNCLDGIYNKKGFEILIIDNGSKDKTIEIIEKDYPLVKFIKNNENIGFGQANNIGLLFALENKYNFVALLNQDTEITVETLNGLISKMKLYPNYGILSPLHFYSENKLQKSFSKHIKANDDLTQDIINGVFSKEIYDLPFVNAAIWLMSIECITRVGGFCPAFYHYGEDDNYCHRALYREIKIGVVPTFQAFHFSHNKNENYFKTRNLEKYKTKLLIDYLNPNINFLIRLEPLKIIYRLAKSIFKKDKIAIIFHFKCLKVFLSANLKELKIWKNEIIFNKKSFL